MPHKNESSEKHLLPQHDINEQLQEHPVAAQNKHKILCERHARDAVR